MNLFIELKRHLIFILLLTITSLVFPQEVNITQALQEIESGNIQNAIASLQEFMKSNPNDPSVIFLDAVLTKNGDEALRKYSTVYENFPQSKYADASLYRIFSYYYSLGIYKKAEDYLEKLKNEYPNSSFIKSADRAIPDEEDINSNNSGTEYKYTIQVGAFLNEDNAKKLYDKLRDDGYDPAITKKEIGGSEFNIVNVGKYKTEEEVKQSLQILSEKYELKGRMVSLD